jgi:hypothetical protein
VQDSTTLERYAELEAIADAKRRAKMRRQPLYLVAVVNLLIIGVALTASVDLRRLRTPGGVALRWTQSAVFGDCSDYLMFSVADGTEDRTQDQLCRDLRARTQQARTDNLQIGLALRTVRAGSRGATVQVTLTRKGAPTPLRLHLVKRSGRWKVLRDTSTCASVGCA